MADHYNLYSLKHFSGIVADCMGMELPENFAPSVNWVSNILKERLGGKADRVILYHADAVGHYMWQKYTNLFAPVYMYSNMSVPFLSTVESVTPVAHATMYTGMDPDGHGIHTYERPKLECTTLFDLWIKEGKKVAIVAQKDSTFLHIFAGRDLDYFEEECGIEVQERALKLIEEDKYDIISIHTFDYDTAAHKFGPESKQALNALSLEAEGYMRIAEALIKNKEGRSTLLTYSPDHGQHLLPGGNGQHGSKMIEDMNIVHFFGTL